VPDLLLRVLVVDDSAVARRLLVEVLGRDPALEVVGEASSGAEALRLAERLRPDVITMDVQPGMDGLETTRRIMEQHPAPIVVVSGGQDPGELVHAVRALDAGALAALRRPRAPADPGFAAEAAELAGTVKRMAEVKVFRRRPAAAPAGGPLPGPPPDGARPTRRHTAELVAVGASTGGPAALATILRAFRPPPPFRSWWSSTSPPASTPPWPPGWTRRRRCRSGSPPTGSRCGPARSSSPPPAPISA
jgi:two-component system chemotaxis response regulator CheB